MRARGRGGPHGNHQWRLATGRGIASLALPGLLATCSLPLFSNDCSDSLAIRPIPVDTTLAVGQQFTAQLSLRTCADTKEVTDPYVWSSEDTSVVRVDSTSGRVVAVGAGQTQLHVQAMRYGPQSGTTVTVR